MRVRCPLFKQLIHINVSPEHIHQIVKGFSNDWKKALDLINQDVMRTFTNFKNGTAILQVRNGIWHKIVTEGHNLSGNI